MSGLVPMDDVAQVIELAGFDAEDEDTLRVYLERRAADRAAGSPGAAWVAVMTDAQRIDQLLRTLQSMAVAALSALRAGQTG